MKEQYVGDVNDYRKYALLRHLAQEARIRIGVCWMLTPPYGRADGNLTKYLEKPPQTEDQELFDQLKKLAAVPEGRRLRHLERNGLLPRAIFFDEYLSDRPALRRAYFQSALEHLGRADLIFFDPDNGLAPPSVPKGSTNSSKYIYRDEIHDAYHAGHSVLLYQHFARETRAAYLDRIAADLSGCAAGAGAWCFWTPHTAFFLFVHPRHGKLLGGAAEAACSRWDPKFIRGKHFDSGS